MSALQAAVAAARERKLAQLQLVREGCRERGITVGQPAFKALRRTDALPFIDEVAYAGVAAPSHWYRPRWDLASTLVLKCSLRVTSFSLCGCDDPSLRSCACAVVEHGVAGGVSVPCHGPQRLHRAVRRGVDV